MGGARASRVKRRVPRVPSRRMVHRSACEQHDRHWIVIQEYVAATESGDRDRTHEGDASLRPGLRDLVTFDREMAYLSGVAYGGVEP